MTGGLLTSAVACLPPSHRLIVRLLLAVTITTTTTCTTTTTMAATMSIIPLCLTTNDLHGIRDVFGKGRVATESRGGNGDLIVAGPVLLDGHKGLHVPTDELDGCGPGLLGQVTFGAIGILQVEIGRLGVILS